LLAFARGSFHPKPQSFLDCSRQVVGQQPNLRHKLWVKPKREGFFRCATRHMYMHFPVAFRRTCIYTLCMVMRKANTYRLYPTPEQAQQMAQIAGSCRYVFNLALEQRRDWYRPGRKFNFASQCREVTALRAEVDWLKAAPVHTLQQALKDLDRAYQNWWADRAQAPTPRKKGLHDSFRFPDPVSIKVERTGNSSGRIKLPKLGWITLRGWYAIPGDICNATVSCRAGQWHVSVQWQREVAEPVPSSLPAVGIDRGIAVFAALSDGTNIAPVNHGKKALRALRKAQRNLSRKKRGSSNRRKAVRRVAKIGMRVANARKNFLHEQTTAIANNHGTVVLEALKVRNMSASAKGTAAEPGKMVRQKAGLNRAILDQGWGGFRIMLAYKLADRGGKLIEVTAAYTSQTCAECGVVDSRSRQNQARFVCTVCGHKANADTNAAIIILKRGLDKSLKPVEGHRSSGPTTQEASGGQLNAALQNPRPSGRGACQGCGVLHERDTNAARNILRSGRNIALQLSEIPAL
jgi:putative transposase